MRILLIKPKQIGDSLILTPTITAIKRAHPEAEIWVLVRRGCEGILAGCPGIARTLTLAGVYALMHRLGYEPLRPRPFHPKRDLAAQESFKKEAPLFSKNSGATTPARSSRSGSKTR